MSAFGLNVGASDGRPLKLIVGYPPGGSVDALARALSRSLHDAYPSGVIVENRAGAASRIAVAYVKNSDPNSNTALMYVSSFTSVYPFVYKNLRYAEKDFAPVTSICDVTFGLSAGPAVPDNIQTFQELVRWIKEDEAVRGQVGISGMGSILHFALIQLASATGLKLTIVSYKGGAPAILDAEGGHVPLVFNVLGEVIPRLQSGKLRLMGTTGATREVPSVPTFKELGLKFTAADSYGLVMPAKAPPQDIEKLNLAVRAAMKSNAVKEIFKTWSFMPANEQSPADFREIIRLEREKWAPIVKASGFVLE